MAMWLCNVLSKGNCKPEGLLRFEKITFALLDSPMPYYLPENASHPKPLFGRPSPSCYTNNLGDFVWCIPVGCFVFKNAAKTHKYMQVWMLDPGQGPQNQCYTAMRFRKHVAPTAMHNRKAIAKGNCST